MFDNGLEDGVQFMLLLYVLISCVLVSCVPGVDGGDREGVVVDGAGCLSTLGARCEDVDGTVLRATQTGVDSNFGMAVAVDGDLLAVGSSHDASCPDGVDESCLGRGAVFVFRRDATGWVKETVLRPKDTTRQLSFFGSRLALNQGVLAVGMGWSEEVYVFREHGGTWSREAVLDLGDFANTSGGQLSLALHGDTLAVGAPAADGCGPDLGGMDCPASGAVFMHDFDGSSWERSGVLRPGRAAGKEHFGFSVAIEGDRLAVGAPGSLICKGDCPSLGTVRMFEKNSEKWIEREAVAAPDPIPELQRFGISVALHGERLVVGALGDSTCFYEGDCDGVGAVHVFVENGLSYKQEAHLFAPGHTALSSFGFQIALSENSLLVGAPRTDRCSAQGVENVETCDAVGAAYLYQVHNGRWSGAGSLPIANPRMGDSAGYAVDLDGDTAIVGVPGVARCADSVGMDEDCGPGSVQVFERRLVK